MDLPQARLHEPTPKAGTHYAMDVVLLPEEDGRLYVSVLRYEDVERLPLVIGEFVLTNESTRKLREVLEKGV